MPVLLQTSAAAQQKLVLVACKACGGQHGTLVLLGQHPSPLLSCLAEHRTHGMRLHLHDAPQPAQAHA
jgi:hypothetical protein